MALYRNKIFPLLAGLLWVTFLFLDITNIAGSTWVKFASICLCCLTAILGGGTFDGKLVATALCFTVAADWFLLVLDKHYTLGVALFLIVQGLYAYRLYRIRGHATPVLWLRLGLIFLWGGFSVIEPSVFQLWCVLLYFVSLCLNTAEAAALNKRVFALGLLLFVCCDLCVGLRNISLFLPPALAEFSRIGMWLFYLPSQVLIVLSQEQKKEYLHEKTV